MLPPAGSREIPPEAVSGRRGTLSTIRKMEASGSSKEPHVREPGGVRDPDRLGDGHPPGVPARGQKDGFTIDKDQLIPLFLETQHEIMSGSYELYAEVLRRTAVTVAEELGWELEPVRSELPAQQHPVLAAVPGHQHAARAAQEEVPGGADLEHRRQAAGRHAPSSAARLRPGGDGAAGAQLQAGSGPLQGVQAAHRPEDPLGPHRLQPGHRRDPVRQAEGAGDLDRRKKEGWPAGQKGKPTEIVRDLRSAVKLLDA